MTDDERFANAITALVESYRQKASAGLYHGYRLGLGGIAIKSVEKACCLALQRSKFMPSPAELRELALTGGTSYESAAQLAFVSLRREVRRLGSDGSVWFSDGAIHATVRRLGGWRACCDQPRSQFDVWYRKSFLATYISILREGASPDECRYLSGRLEAHNADWEGSTLPGGRIFRSEEFGGGIHRVDVPYTPALPAPAPQPRRAISAGAAMAGLRLRHVDAATHSNRLPERERR